SLTVCAFNRCRRGGSGASTGYIRKRPRPATKIPFFLVADRSIMGHRTSCLSTPVRDNAMERDNRFADLPSAEWDELQDAVEQFESAWHSGAPPAIEDYLPRDPARRLAVLVELVHTDLELRLKARLPVRVEEYLERFPELDQAPKQVIDLV